MNIKVAAFTVSEKSSNINVQYTNTCSAFILIMVKQMLLIAINTKYTNYTFILITVTQIYFNCNQCSVYKYCIRFDNGNADILIAINAKYTNTAFIVIIVTQIFKFELMLGMQIQH